LAAQHDSFADVDQAPTQGYGQADVQPQEDGVLPEGYNPDDWKQK